MDRPIGPRAVLPADVELPERYELVRLIAHGGMASVWCARDRVLERVVAIKLLAGPYAHDELAVRRFKREARTAARVSGHRNVVTIYDVGQASPSDRAPLGRPFIVMEHLAGGTVADALRVGEVDRDRVVQWLHEAAAALDYAHGRGVIHRDVKLANFLLDSDRILHVADFGIAQANNEVTLTGAGELLGTAAYLAPERALGQPASAASDRYSLAVAAFELLTGERPFAGTHFATVARAQIEEPVPSASARNPQLPRRLDAVLARGMAKLPEQRYGSAGELADAVERALTGEPTLARPLPAAHAPTSSSRRLAAVIALGAAALGFGIAVEAGHLQGNGRLTAAASASATSHPARHRAATQPPREPVNAVAEQPTTSTPPSHVTIPPPAPTLRATDPAALQAEGHQLMLSGDYAAAIPLLRQAVARSSPASLVYAYALYDLGHSLRMAGDPRAAVEVLWRRLQIPNQQSVVRAELTLALQALGQQLSGGGGPAGTRGGAQVGPGGPGGPGGSGAPGAAGGPTPGPAADPGPTAAIWPLRGGGHGWRGGQDADDS